MFVLVVATVALGSIYMFVKFSDFDYLWYAIITAMTLSYSICILLNPELINTKVVETSTAGEDAVTMMTVASKASIKLAPIIFGSLVIFGVVQLTIDLIGIAQHGMGYILEYGMDAAMGIILIFVGLLYPLISYISFAFFYLIYDLLQALLSLGKNNAK